MKNEKLLLNLPVKELDIEIPEPTQFQERNVYSGKYYTHTKHYGAFVVETINNDILIITIYERKKNGQAKVGYRLFMSDYDYVSQTFDNRGLWKRSTMKIDNYKRTTEEYWHKKYICSEDNRDIAVKFLKSYKSEKPDIFKRINGYINDIGKRKLEEKHDRIRKSVDDRMLQIKDLPKDFEKWLDDVVFKDSRYILYEYSRKKLKKGYCSYCKNYVSVDARHNQKGKCPNCKSKVTFIARGRAMDHNTVQKHASYIQGGKDNELIFRTFTVTRNIQLQGDKLIISDSYREDRRDFYFADKRFVYEYRDWEHKYNWFPEYSCHTESGYVYYKNIKNLLKKRFERYPHLKYIPYADLLKNTSNITARRLYITVLSEPQIEYLAKLKLYKLASELINGDLPSDLRETGNILKALNLKKEDIKYLQKYNMGKNEIETYQMCKKAGQLQNLEFFLEAADEYLYGYTENIISLLDYVSFEAIIAYKAEQFKIYREKSHSWYSDRHIESDMISDWIDYITNCKKLGWNLKDTKVIKPKNLKERHDLARELVKLEGADSKAIKENYYKNIFDLYYFDKNYTVTMPRDAWDLKYEGDKLHHCVYTNYAEDVADGSCIIVVIRDNNEFYKPLATAELDPDNYRVRQIRADHNNAVSKEVRAFFDKYTEKVLKPLRENKERNVA